MTRMQVLVGELTRTAIAFATLLLTASLMAAIQLHNDNVSIRLGLNKLPSLVDASRPLHGVWWVRPWMADSSLYVMVGGAAAGLLVYCQGRVVKAVQIVRRFLWLLAIGYGMRAVCLWGTVLPPSNPHCVYVERDVWAVLRAVPQLLGGATHTCSDKIFSGHTLVATLLAAFWFRLCHSSVGRVYAAANWSAMVCSSLAGRHHYTVDIVVGCLVAALLFHVYHLVLGLVVDEIDRVPLIVKRAVHFMDGLDLRDEPAPTLLPTTAGKL